MSWFWSQFVSFLNLLNSIVNWNQFTLISSPYLSQLFKLMIFIPEANFYNVTSNTSKMIHAYDIRTGVRRLRTSGRLSLRLISGSSWDERAQAWDKARDTAHSSGKCSSAPPGSSSNYQREDNRYREPETSFDFRLREKPFFLPRWTKTNESFFLRENFDYLLIFSFRSRKFSSLRVS